MAYKNYGLGVSQLPQGTALGGQFSGEDKSFESVVIQTTKPVIDWEMNLRDEISSDHGVRLNNSRHLPSHWLNAGFNSSPSISSAYSFPAPVVGGENNFYITPQDLIVNGWNLKFQYSDSLTINKVSLPSGPVAGYRVDLVILEVWRALVSSAPSFTNKSASGKIVRHGNVKSYLDAINLVDDIKDPTEGAETSLRVQIQYRYRVISGVDIKTYPDGCDDPAVTARTVSDFIGSDADGTATAYAYTKAPDDAGLWVAGVGTAVSAAALGTVDGYMYSTPICAVFRRNRAAYDRITNTNGGSLIVAGVSDRPDGLFADQVIGSDIRDLRRGCAHDFSEILQKTTQQLFNNSLSTELEIPISGIGGTSLSVVDDITNTDGVRRHFSDRSITETIVCCYTTVAPLEMSFIVELSTLKLPWNPGGINVFLASLDASIISVNKIRMVNVADACDISYLTSTDIKNVILWGSGAGTRMDVATINLKFGAPIGYTFMVELSIEYLSGGGLSRNVIDEHAVWAPNHADAWVDDSLFTATSDVDRFSLDSILCGINRPHRETFLRLKTINVTSNFVSADGVNLYIPERIASVSVPASTFASSDTAYTVVTPIAAPGVGAVVAVTYKAYRPAPILSGIHPDDSYNVFYQSRAVQSLQPAAGNQTLYLTPKVNPDNIYSIVSGSGSPDDSFPFESPGAQIPIGAIPYYEYRLDNPNPVSIIGFGVNTGFIKLDAKVPYFPDADAVTLYRSAVDSVVDGDGRYFWPRSSDPAGVVAVYSPVVHGHLLTTKQRHKVAVPVLMELTSDVASVGRKGTLFLVVFSNWLEFSDENSVQLVTSTSSSCAAVYRVRGNLINPQRSI
jgi:hypothetical protein